jgi:predicted dehydrogenase
MSETHKLRWGLVGCGVIGERRAQALPEGVQLVACFDPNLARAEKISQMTGARIAGSALELIEKDKVDAVILAGVNSVISEGIALFSKAGIPVLAEKPAARSFNDLHRAQKESRAPIKIGFNHRFHPAYQELRRQLHANLQSDPIMIIRAQYGNGARLGFEKEWRANPEISGGGELLDQGVHVIDLALGLVPDLKLVTGYAKTHYWDMPVDDNGWGILNSASTGATFSFHVSACEWKNEFRFEVYTRKTKYQWLGLGRSYGPEKLIIHRMTPEMGPPKTEELSFPSEDRSWLDENTHFAMAIKNKSKLDGDVQDGMNALKVVEDIYKSSKLLQPTGKHPEWWKE